MASTDQLIKTDTPGLFYKEHETRKTKDGRKIVPDRQWIIRQTLGGKTRVSTFGWQEGNKISRGDVVNKITEYRANHEWNQLNPDVDNKPICLSDEKRMSKQIAAKIQQKKLQIIQDNLTINDLWKQVYLPAMEGSKKKQRTLDSETSLYGKWIKNGLGKKRPEDLTTLDYSRLSKKMLAAGKSPRTVHYVVSIIMQVWGLAFDEKLVKTQPPRRKSLHLPDIDNERTRAFTPDEAREFLIALKERSQQWYDISLLSLLTGMRAGEIFKLKRDDIDLENKRLFLQKPKKAKSQYLQISDQAVEHIRQVLAAIDEGQKLLFVTARKGLEVKEVSDSVQRTIDNLKMNEGVEARNKLTFHSLRHTTATWLLEQGEDIYRVSKLLRHSTVRVTEQRYAHLSGNTMQGVANKISLSFDEPTNIVSIDNIRNFADSP